jgi:homoserine O-succinyltransferase/O-acetyltransferase
MPVLIDSAPTLSSTLRERGLTIGLVNNMPDAALESTERQFLELLRAAAGDHPVRLRLYALADVPRSETGRQRLREVYVPIEELWSSDLDGLIVTGTEPRAPRLADEPYWGSLTQVMDWAEHNTTSTVWSCLAAHAAVLHLDGVERQLLEDKQFGVFDCAVATEHPLMAGISGRIRIPHSRWNALPESALASRGYTVVTRSAEAGVDTFVKQRKSLFVFFQGHPEYDERALLREYRRDIGRFLRRERESYPEMPRGYFDQVSANVLAAFRAIAVLERREDMLASFPLAFLEARLERIGRASVVQIYANWLSYLDTQKAQHQVSPRSVPRVRRTDAIAPVQGVV